MKFLKKLAEQMPDEILGYKTYMELSEMTEDASEKQKLVDMANNEKNHYDTIRQMLENYM